MSESERPVRSVLVAQLSGVTLLDRLVRFIRQAGSPSEDSYDRDGFLSYHAEPHALGAGIGLGFMALAAGDLRVLGLLLELVLFGNRSERLLEPRLVGDILQERHYFLGGIVLGGLVGLLARVVLSVELLPVEPIAPFPTSLEVIGSA